MGKQAKKNKQENAHMRQFQLVINVMQETIQETGESGKASEEVH